MAPEPKSPGRTKAETVEPPAPAANAERRIRVGIDVGGTFTHAVAIDAGTFEVVAQKKVPTTHTAAAGVAQGIVDSLHQMLEAGRISPDEVVLIAHSTTQATNALLEGDVAVVGVVGMGAGALRRQAARQTNVGRIELAPGRFLQTRHCFFDTTDGLDEAALREALDRMRGEGAEVVVASEAFGVEQPANETRVAEIAREMGLGATAAHEISQLLGLRIRTRTAVINASMLPKMMETANMTEQSVREAGIRAPLMIVRSDGGIMDIEQMRRRPILTMLSGPAAGVAAALMYARITDGIFIEVGGTSSDCSAIRNGKALVKSATVGGFPLSVRTLDVRTLGIAGGSMPRARGDRVVDVGPRSAHIAQLGYAAFEDFGDGDIAIDHIDPKTGDPKDYVRMTCDGAAFTVTPTCAANALGFVPDDSPARGDSGRIGRAFAALGRDMGGISENDVATRILDRSFPKVANVVEDLIEDYDLDRNLLTLSGGGGGAWAIVPYTAKKMGLPHEIAPNAPMISAIGAALALVRDSIERTVVDPSESEILDIRREAEMAVVRMGADPATVEVQVEIDPQKNILRATATGSTEFRSRDLSKRLLEPNEIADRLRKSVRERIVDLRQIGDIGGLLVYEIDTETPKWFGLGQRRWTQVRVIDREGVIRLQLSRGEGVVCRRSLAVNQLRPLVAGRTVYGDAGRALPDVFVVYRGRILDLTGLQTFDQVQTLMTVELDQLPPSEEIAALVQFSGHAA